MATEFYDREGLRLIGRLILAERQSRGSERNVFARLVGLAPSTVKNLEEARLSPQPDNLLKIAPYVTNPVTGLPFDPEDFLAIARGRLQIQQNVDQDQQNPSFFGDGSSRSMEGSHTNHRILMPESSEIDKNNTGYDVAGHLSRSMINAGYSSVAEYAEFLGLDPDRFLEIMLAARIPDITEIAIIAHRVPLPHPLPEEAAIEAWLALWGVKADTATHVEATCSECNTQEQEHKATNGSSK